MTKDDIVKTAFKVWGRELYQTMSLTAVAAELGVSKTALYRHFKDKEALLGTMNNAFFEEFAAFIKKDYEAAVAAEDIKESCLLIIRTICEYYARNPEAFVYCLFRVFGSGQAARSSYELAVRGVDLDSLFRREKEAYRDLGEFSSRAGDEQKNTDFAPLDQLAIITLSFWVAEFHRLGHKSGKPPSESEIGSLVLSVVERIEHGLDLPAEESGAIDFSELEVKAAVTLPKEKENNRFLDAVAGAVAEAGGPTGASMEMVARRLGITKSSIYAHFKNKNDMILEFYTAEFNRIADYTKKNVKTTSVPAEQLYLVLACITSYLESRPEILISLDWFRTWRVGLRPEVPLGKDRVVPKFYRIITGINIPAFKEAGDKKNLFAQWILFLIVSSLMWRPEKACCFSPVNLRVLYRFITRGLGGFDT